MKNILLGCFTGLCLAASPSFADSQFPCPAPNQLTVTPNYLVLYAPDLTADMPASLKGTNVTGVNAAFSGPIIGPSYYRIDNIAFSNVGVPTTNGVPDAVYCIYALKGADENNAPISSLVYLTPGSPTYLDQFNYALTNGQEYSTDISTLIVAKNKT